MMSAQDIREAATRDGFDADPGDAAALADTMDLPQPGTVEAWRAGYSCARKLRDQEGLDGAPISDVRLAELAGTTAAAITQQRGRSGGLSFALDGPAGRARVALRSKWKTGRRFALARLIGDRTLGAAGGRPVERLFPATRACSYRQKAQRAFAAELPSPFGAVEGMLKGDYSEGRQTEAARRFDVSPMTIRTLLVNHGHLARAEAPDFDGVRRKYPLRRRNEPHASGRTRGGTLPRRRRSEAMRKLGGLVFGAATACLALAGAARADADHRRPDAAMPNIVMIVSDDQSYRDFGFLGNDLVSTPHIDRLAAASARYPAGYVPMSLCRASLATLLTGLYPHQHGIHFNHPPPGYGKMRDMTAAQYRATRAKTDDLIRNAPTLPAILTRHGYAALQTGKHWEGHYANAGFTHGMTTARPAGRLGDVTGTRTQTNGEWVAHGNGDAGLVIGRETMRPIWDFIDEQAGRRPFFVWYAPFLPHTPYDAPPEYERAARASGAPPHLVPYYAQIARLDDTVGRLLAYLEEKALLASTLIVFVVDNGLRPDPAQPTRQNARSKYSPYEDGLRTPVLLRWDGRIEPGDHLQPVSTVDLVPTILSAAGLVREVTPRMRGRDLFPSAAGVEDLPAAPVFGAIYPSDATSLGHPSRHVRGRWIRNGDFKLIVPGPGPDPLPTALYDLREDPGETTNLAALPAQGRRVARMKRLLDEWWPATGDEGASDAAPSADR